MVESPAQLRLDGSPPATFGNRSEQHNLATDFG